MEITNKTLYTIIREFAQDNGKKRIFFTDERCYSIEEFKNEVARLACFFAEHSIKPGDMVALRVTRCIDSAVLYFALEALGACVVLVDPHNGVKNVPAELGLPIRANITNEAAEGGIAAEGDWKLIVDGAVYDVVISNGKETADFTEPQDILKKPGTIIFTSGSTGGQKAVTLSQFNVVNHAHNYGYGGCYRQTDISPEVLPLYHVFGLAVLLTALIHRYEVHFPKEVTPDKVAEAIIAHGMTRLDGVPSMLLAVAKYYEEKNIPSESLRIGVIGGAVISAEQFSFIEKTLKVRLVPVYGMSECIGISGLPENGEEEDRRLTVGPFLPLNKGCIMADDGTILSDGQQGEVCVQSPVVMLGYYSQGNISADNIDERGWLHSGDLGYVDANGNLHISGRKKDIIIRNGNNISINDIAKKLLTIDGVSDVLVVGITDEAVGEVPAALVITDDPEGFEKAHEKVLSKLERLAKYIFVEQIPLTSSGKPDRMTAKKKLS